MVAAEASRDIGGCERWPAHGGIGLLAYLMQRHECHQDHGSERYHTAGLCLIASCVHVRGPSDIAETSRAIPARAQAALHGSGSTHWKRIV